jgi:hypothetical protein
MIYTAHSGSRPVEIFKASAGGGQPVPLTRLNEQILSQYGLTPFEEFWVENPTDEAKIHSFLLKPTTLSISISSSLFSDICLTGVSRQPCAGAF